MTEYIIIGAATLGVFALFLGIMAMKEKRASARPPIHTCANGIGCQCSSESRRDGSADGRKPCSQEVPSETRRR